MVFLFVGVPGGAEILVVLLVALVVFGLPIVLIGGGLYLYRRSQSDHSTGEEIAALREEIHELRAEVRALSDDESGGDETPRDERDFSDE